MTDPVPTEKKLSPTWMAGYRYGYDRQGDQPHFTARASDDRGEWMDGWLFGVRHRQHQDFMDELEALLS